MRVLGSKKADIMYGGIQHEITQAMRIICMGNSLLFHKSPL